MKIVKILRAIKGATDATGNVVRIYEVGEQITVDADWKQNLVSNFISSGYAEEVKITAPLETKEPKIYNH